jgi:hypothetical protein
MVTERRSKKIVDQLLPGRGYENSLFRQMLSEGIIAADMYYVGHDKPAIEVIHFAYERLTDHLVVQYLLNKNLDLKNPSDAFTKGKLLNVLLGEEQSAWKNRGLIEALSIQLPERTGRELVELAPFCADFRSVQEAFLQSLIWRKPNTIQKAAIDYINSHNLNTQDGYDQLMNILLTVAPRTDHPLNARFLHNNLKDKSLPQRDSSWSVFLHYNYGSTGIIRRLIDWGWFAKDKQYASDESVFLTSLTLAWFLTSSNRFIRDRATKALVSLLEKRLHVLTDILKELSDVNDPYISERIYGAAYGCSLRSTNTKAIGKLGQHVYDFVFDKGTPPPNILLRDYARGVVEVALQRGCTLKIDPEKIRPPYHSDWIDNIPSETELRNKYYPKDQSQKPSYISIWWSVMSDGDFARYIIGTNSSSFNWSSRRLNTQYGPTRKEQFDDFIASLTERQKNAFYTYQNARSSNRLSIIIDANGNSELFEHKYSKKEAETIKKKALQNLIYTLGKKKKANLDKIALPYLENPTDETAFDLSLAQRWIFKKVVDLGWAPELFGEFEKYLNYHDARESHKSERIGKKYQWIAYHEFLARVSDNFQWVGRYDGGTKYEGPWQFWGRDIDPSFLLHSTGYRPYEEAPSWWFYPKYEAWERYKEDIDWLKTHDDLPEYQMLLESSNPMDGSKWLLLDGSFAWEQPVPIGEDKYENSRKEIWYIFKSYFVKKKDVDEVFTWMTKQNFMGRWMPESLDIYRMFLGEYPWASSVPSEWIEEWTQGREPKIPKSILCSTSRYVWEGSGYDCSLEDTVSIQLPCKWLMEQMGLCWNGEEGYFRDNKGRLVVFDPSVYEKGPTVLLAKKELLSELDKNGYEILWTILGEKQILGPSTNQGEWKGRLEVSGVIRIKDNHFEAKINPIFREPE